MRIPQATAAAEVGRDLFELGARIAEAAENDPEIFKDNHWTRYGAQVDFNVLIIFSEI